MSKTNLSELQIFAVVARFRSFRGAAAELGVSPSALSHTMRHLEARLQVRLLNRTTRSVAPTEAGRQLLARLAPALLEIESALETVNIFRASPHGSLRINAPRAAIDLVLAPLMADFLQEYPGIRVELIADSALVDIVAEGFDAGVRFGESLQRDMVAVPLGPPQRFIVVGAPKYLAIHGRPLSPHDLHRHACVRLRFANGAYYRWEFAKDGEQLDVDVDGPLAVNDMSLSIGAAEDGVGLSYVYAQYAAAGLAAGRLTTVIEDWCPEIPGFFLYYPSRTLMPAGLGAFVKFLAAWRNRRTAGTTDSE